MNEHPDLKTFAKYVFVALLSSLIDLSLFTLLCKLFTAHGLFSVAGLYVSVATVAARITSATCNYLMNYRIVFRSKASKMQSLSRYALLCVIQMCVSAFLVTFIHGLVGGEELFVKIPVDLTLFVVNFFVQRELVYR